MKKNIGILGATGLVGSSVLSALQGKPVLIIQGAKDDQVEVNNSLYSLRKDVINNQAEFLLEKNRGHYPTRIENEKDIVINKEIFEVIKEYIKDT